MSVRAKDEFSRLPGWLKKLGTLSSANWMVWWGVTVFLQGTALGTKVHHNQYVLVDRGRLTSVSQSLWWFSLVYSWLSNLLPCVVVWLALLYFDRLEPVGKVFVILGALFSVLWLYAVCLGGFGAVFSWSANH